MSQGSDDNPQSISPWLLHQDQVFFDELQQFSSEQISQSEQTSQSEHGESEQLETPLEEKEASDLSKTQVSGTSTETTQNESETKARRRIQNRVAQRAFRERKQSYAKDLQSRVNITEEQVERLRAEKVALEHVLQRAKTENERLQQQTNQNPEHPIATILLDRRGARQEENVQQSSSGQGQQQPGQSFQRRLP